MDGRCPNFPFPSGHVHLQLPVLVWGSQISFGNESSFLWLPSAILNRLFTLVLLPPERPSTRSKFKQYLEY